MNDQRRFRPRLPRHGYYTIAEDIPPTEKAGRKWTDRFGYAGNDVRAEWAGSDVEIVTFCAWFAARRRVAAVDPANRVVTLAGVDQWPESMPLPKGERFLVDNVREALGEPGQWYLDRRSGELTYIPLPGEQPEKTTVIAPRAERLLVIEGDLKNHRYVEHLRFLGLTLAHSNWVMTRAGPGLRPVGIQHGRGGFGDRRAEPGVRRLRRAPRGHLRHGLRRRLPRQPHRELRDRSTWPPAA